MGANNWTTCPSCEAGKVHEVDELERSVRDCYGQVTAQEFMALMNKVASAKDALNKSVTDADMTFREDYSITGANEGEVTVKYRGFCTRCGLKAEFNHVHPFFPEGE